MDGGYVNRDVLILVKTYPTPSEKHKEVVCTAGITSSGEWVRLYPIPYRNLEDYQKYGVFQWINVDIKKNKRDPRPESHKVIAHSITPKTLLTPQRDIETRLRYINMIRKGSMEEVWDEYESYGKTLACFRPKKVLDFLIRPESSEWSEAEMAKLQQTSFLEKRTLKPLRKVPYSFHIRYQCDDPRCKRHTQTLIEWEIGAAYWEYLSRYTEKEALTRLKEKYIEKLDSAEYDRFFFVGTLSNHPQTFTLIGQYSYKPKNRRIHPGQLSFLE